MSQIYLKDRRGVNRFFGFLFICAGLIFLASSTVYAADDWKKEILGKSMLIGTSSSNLKKVTVSPNNPEFIYSTMTITENTIAFESKAKILRESVCKDYKFMQKVAFESWFKEWEEGTPDDYYPSLNVFNGGQVIEVSCGSGSFKMIPFAISKDGTYIGFPGFDTDYYTFSKYGD